MRGFWKWVASAISTLVVSLLVIYLEPEIQQWRTGQELRAELYMGPWMAFPPVWDLSDSRNDIQVETLRKHAADEISALGRLDIQNTGASTISAIRLDLDEADRYWAIIVGGDVEKAIDLGQPRFVEAPDLKPGERISIYLLSIYDISYRFRRGDIKLTASTGRVPIEVRSQTIEITGVDSLGDWILLVPIGIGVGTVILLIVGMASSEAYYKRLLANEDYYLEEKVRFDKDPKRFVPKAEASIATKAGKSPS